MRGLQSLTFKPSSCIGKQVVKLSDCVVFGRYTTTDDQLLFWCFDVPSLRKVGGGCFLKRLQRDFGAFCSTEMSVCFI